MISEALKNRNYLPFSQPWWLQQKKTIILSNKGKRKKLLEQSFPSTNYQVKTNAKFNLSDYAIKVRFYNVLYI